MDDNIFLRFGGIGSVLVRRNFSLPELVEYLCEYFQFCSLDSPELDCECDILGLCESIEPLVTRVAASHSLPLNGGG